LKPLSQFFKNQTDLIRNAYLPEIKDVGMVLKNFVFYYYDTSRKFILLAVAFAEGKNEV
jgi:hypothetical protein